MGRVKKPYNRFYKGVFYWYSNKKWYCDLFDFPRKHPFKTQKDVKLYICDYIENTKFEKVK